MANTNPFNDSTVIRVLHVDDDSTFLEVSKLILSELDSRFLMDTACSVDEAFIKLTKNVYDVIITDYEMPHKNGLDFLKELQQQNNGSLPMPFILFTGKGREEIAIQALNLGADGYFNKQGSPETVYGELAHGIKAAVSANKAKLAHKLAEEKFSKTFKNGPTSITITRLSDGKIVDANDSFFTLLGYTPEEVIGQTTLGLGLWADPNDRISLVKALKENGFVQNQEFALKRKDGNKIVINASASTIAIGNEKCFISSIVDITERKKAEEALRKSESHYRLLADNAKDVIWTMTLDGRFTYISPSVYQLRGYTSEEALQQSLTETLTLDSAAIVLEGIQLFRQTGEIALKNFELEQPCKNGKTVWVEINFTVLKDKDGNPESILGVSRNINERKKTETALTNSEKSNRDLSYLLNQVGQAIILVEETRKIRFWNKEAEKLYGWPEKEVLGKDIVEIIGNGPTLKEQEEVSRRLKAGETWSSQLQAKRKDGSLIPVVINRTPLFNDEGVYMGAVIIATDITEIKNANGALAESEAKYRALVENADDAILLADLTGNTIYRNPAYYKQLGFKEGESDVFAKVHPDDKAIVKENMRNLLKTGYSTSQYRVKHHNGSWVYRLARSTLIYNQLKEAYAILSIIRDVTQQKEAEEKLQKDQVNIANMNEKLRVVGSLTRHDVRNKLTAINAYSYILKKKYADKPDIVEGLGKMVQSVQDSMKIFDFAKTYEQLGVENLVDVDVKVAVDEATAMFSDLPFKVINECTGLRVQADSLLRQLIYNFIDNSKKHGKKTTEARLHYKKTPNGDVQLIYEDNGVGIPIDNKQYLFKQGFSTGGSTGFGLFLSKKIIAVYGWKIDEEGKPGNGARFVITIPQSDRKYHLYCDIQACILHEPAEKVRT